MSAPEVNVTINGETIKTEKGRLLIDVAEEAGIFVPRFCYHPGMKSVAVCRMCLVKVEGQGKLLPACATPVDEGMIADTVDSTAVDAQKSMLEFLLINHPLDCPICDRAGECPLQDQTYMHGPGTSRYIEPKRTYEKALEISELVVLDRERCVLCWRCVRFSDEIAGDRFIQLVDRGAGTQILTFNDEPFDSYFSGNTIQICPVGALTAKPYRFVSRPWDLEETPSVCSYCSVGCPITNEERGGDLVRVQAMPNEEVNDYWICDKGRFGFHHVSADDRLVTPLVRSEAGEFEVAGWARALEVAAEHLKDKKVGIIAGGHLTTEDAFAVSRFARGVLKSNDIDSRIQDAGTPYERLIQLGGAAGSTATISDLDSAGTIVWVGPDPKEALPVLYLRLRGAVLDNRARLVVVSVRRNSLDDVATKVVRCEPEGEAQALTALTDLEGPVVVCWGPSSPGRDEGPVLDAVIAVAKSNGAKVLACPPHAGSQGMLDMGVHPALDIGYKNLSEPGRDTQAILEAAAAGEIDTLLLIGADPVSDFPDAALARKALESKVFTIAIDILPSSSVAFADVVLPSAAYAERGGTFTNLERRVQRLEPLVPRPGSALEPWKALQKLASQLGTDWGWKTWEDVWGDIAKASPSHKGIDTAALSGRQVEPPKGHRGGAPFQTGQNWPLSWELRAFESRLRPGAVPSLPEAAHEPEPVAEGAPPASATASATGGGLVLYTGRHIYDASTMLARSTFLSKLARKPFVEVSPEDAERLGITDGQEVTVSAGPTSVRLPVVVGDIAGGAVYIPFGQPGLNAGDLITGTNPRVEVKI